MGVGRELGKLGCANGCFMGDVHIGLRGDRQSLNDANPGTIWEEERIPNVKGFSLQLIPELLCQKERGEGRGEERNLFIFFSLSFFLALQW